MLVKRVDVTTTFNVVDQFGWNMLHVLVKTHIQGCHLLSGLRVRIIGIGLLARYDRPYFKLLYPTCHIN